MSDEEGVSSAAPTAVTAGGLLRQARQAKGLHIAALATSIKVAPRKLELLEGDRFDELPGATFTRALAQTVCRSLKIDSAPVLALLPQATDRGLEHLSLGLNAPFRDRPGRRVPKDLQFLKSPFLLGVAVLLLATAAVYFLPAGWINENLSRTVSSPEATPAAEATTPPPALVLVAPAEPALPASAAADAAPPAAPAASTSETSAALAPATPAAPAVPSADTPVAGVLQLRASAESWIEVIDGRGAALISRMLRPGETVGLDGTSPLRVKIGNATATTVTFKGKPVELGPTRDNVAKLELK
jgi:cytoskeleton protein RodZ